MNKSKTFQDLVVWQKAHRFVLSIYTMTKAFPCEEQYGLTFQFRRAAVSVPANIAEGYKKRSNKDKVRFFNIAQGSLEECRYYLILSQDLQYSKTTAEYMFLLEEVSKLLQAYSNTIKT